MDWMKPWLSFGGRLERRSEVKRLRNELREVRDKMRTRGNPNQTPGLREREQKITAALRGLDEDVTPA